MHGHRESEEAPARVLAMMLAPGGGCASPHIVQRLEELDAFARIGIGRGRFLDLLDDCADEFGLRLRDCSWLRDSDERHIDALLQAIGDPRQRVLLCQLAAAVIGIDDSVSNNRRVVLDHVLSRWRIDPALAAPPAP